MAVDPYHLYSNESEKPNKDSYDDFKPKKNTLASKVFIKKFSALRVK